MTENNLPPEKLLEWVRGVETTGCVRIEARHLQAGVEATSAVCQWDIKDTDTGERFDAPAIWLKLEEDAEGFGGIQRYTLLAYRDGAKSARDRLTLRVDGGTDGDPSSTEPATAHGLLAQAHRHNEAMMNVVVRTIGHALSTLERQNKVLSEALEKADHEKVEMWQTMTEIAKGDRDKRVQEHQLQLRAKQEDVLRDGIKLAIPGLINKFLPSKDAQDTGLRRFVESLTPEQQSAIFGTLKPEQAATLASLLDEFIQKDKSEEKASQKAE